MPLISGGELVLADATPGMFRMTRYAPAGIDLAAQFASYGTIYKKQLWVYTLVRKRALATRRLPLKVYERQANGSRVELRDSDLARLLRQPNPRMSGELLWEWTSSTFDVYGEALWLKVRGRNGVPAELWPVHPSNVAVRDDGQGNITYIYGVGVVIGADPQFVIPERDIVHFKSYSPDTTTRGLSPLEPLRQTLVNEDAARRSSSAFWQNGARPSGYLSHPGQLSPAAAERLKAQWDAIHGGVDNFGKWAILEEGMEPKVLSLSAEESQYIESRRLNREEVCAAYDVPPPVVHILDRATFSNIVEQMRSLYRDTMAPHLGGFESTIDYQLRPEFAGDAVYAEFLMDEVLRGDFEQRVNAYQAGINAGWLTPAEVRAMENLPNVDGADQLFVNSTLIPIDVASKRSSDVAPALNPATPTTDTAPAQPEADVAVRSLMGRLGRVKSVDDVDEDALVAGLNGHTDAVLAAIGAARSAGDDIDGLRRRVRLALTAGESE